ncbi:LLM class flavin-dependent oxidoreductase [Nonomuraea endophytica]|uniref:Alkanesulfonate monooxygenase SsuD/methylene tetrahydromethanopterin reductase-like flavin-dependent oxidoreductase (Luciferase family) n=1 Tax=Nonomuraea endophytica TaxID=714136 RepID=A0A7W8ACH4_9ACTN|nr:LLM class flavin-dependent oxidoreductase [Nonomuraea endophytica]MBB5083632.1 alkanesulfonate monooxygenase SsuD/methylene tetrahydromethanopterin reductase-like flavin-dependent oxidoreductase (luciferase family) [Nonomuraea endophytica]
MTTLSAVRPSGVQIAPWVPAGEILSASSVLGAAFSTIWVPDQMLSRNAHILMSAIAAGRQVGVASGVTIPLSRNPIDIASAMATVAELVAPDCSVQMGVGTGGSLVSSMFSKRAVLDLLRECIGLIRRLWAGEIVLLRDYPLLRDRLGWREDAIAQLSFPVTKPIPILMAVGGPKTRDLAEDVADGMICTSTYPAVSYTALESGDHAFVGELVALRDRRAAAGRPFRLLYGLNCCVSQDGDAAREFARRQAAIVAGNPALWPDLSRAGFDMESCAGVRTALRGGAPLAEAARDVSDDLLDGLLISGTPEDCAERMRAVERSARSAGFGEFYLGAPLGPDIGEAAQLLVEKVLPAVWPDERWR